MIFTLGDISHEILEAFYGAFEGPKTFLQSPGYATFRASVGETVFLKGIYDEGTLVGTAVIIKVCAKRGTYLVCGHGPLFVEEYKDDGIRFFLDWYAAFGKEQRCDFVRFNGFFGSEKETWAQAAGYRPSPVYMVNPERTLLLDITQDEEALLAQMKKSMRYEVRKSQKSGITVKMGNKPKDLEVFWKLHKETFSRKHFTPFAKKNTEKELAAFGANAQIFTAYVDGEAFASSLMIFDDTTVYYHQGASKYSKLPVAHATLWAAIKEAKARGCTVCNFWGVSEADNKEHPWYGLSKFKRGFGGQEVCTMHAHDRPLKLKYWLNYCVERYRRLKRGY